jgi:hypothetical protein
MNKLVYPKIPASLKPSSGLANMIQCKEVAISSDYALPFSENMAGRKSCQLVRKSSPE